jgi:hypothetical protein
MEARISAGLDTEFREISDCAQRRMVDPGVA